MEQRERKLKLSEYMQAARREQNGLSQGQVTDLLVRPAKQPFIKTLTFKIFMAMSIMGSIITVSLLFFNTEQAPLQEMHTVTEPNSQVQTDAQASPQTEIQEQVVTERDSKAVEQATEELKKKPALEPVKGPVSFEGPIFMQGKHIELKPDLQEFLISNKKADSLIDVNSPSILDVEIGDKRDLSGIMPARPTPVDSNAIGERLENNRENQPENPALLAPESIRTISLSPKTLRELNIWVADSGVCYHSTMMNICFQRNYLAIKLNLHKKQTDTFTKLPESLVPLMITDNFGKEARFSNYKKDVLRDLAIEMGYGDIDTLQNDTVKKVWEEFISRNLNTLIPVLVRSGLEYTLGDNFGPDAIFWFIPNDDLLKYLPDQVASEIKTDFKIITKAPDVKPQTATCKYFEVCKASSKVVETLKVYPNPSPGHLNVELDLSGDAQVSMRLYSIGGSLLQTFDENAKLSKGISTLSFNISALPDGIYLLVVESGEGQFNFQRIVKTE